jgi:hypothetical protein
MMVSPLNFTHASSLKHRYFIKLSNVSSQDTLFQHVHQYGPGMSYDGIELPPMKIKITKKDRSIETDKNGKKEHDDTTNNLPHMLTSIPSISSQREEGGPESLEFPSPTVSPNASSSSSSSSSSSNLGGGDSAIKSKSKLQPLASPRTYSTNGRSRSGTADSTVLTAKGNATRPYQLDKDNLENTSDYSDIDPMSTPNEGSDHSFWTKALSSDQHERTI